MGDMVGGPQQQMGGPLNVNGHILRGGAVPQYLGGQQPQGVHGATVPNLFGGISPQLLQAALGQMMQQSYRPAMPPQGATQTAPPSMSPNVANFAQDWNKLRAQGQHEHRGRHYGSLG